MRFSALSLVRKAPGKGQWMPAYISGHPEPAAVLIWCPDCGKRMRMHLFGPPGHVVGPLGLVDKPVECARSYCGWTARVYLIGWPPGASPPLPEAR